MKKIKILFLFLFSFLFSLITGAQNNPTGMFQGQISDASGAALQGATVNLLDEEFFSYTEFDFSSNPIGASPGRPRWFLLTANYRF